jgi:3-methyladenine DNA glycosylase AlkD
MATFADTMSELERLGSTNIRNIYRRHGAGENVFGVKFGDMKPLAKRIKTDHALAIQLWDTGNYDARMLAAMIADPKQATSDLLEHWVRSHDNYGHSDAVSGFAAKTVYIKAKAEAWSQESSEWISMTGWNLLGQLALRDKSLPDSYFEQYLKQIEREIHDKPNYTRYAMNNALIAIGTRNLSLEKRALAVGREIGDLRIDHGETGCVTPDACAYIRKTVDRKGYLVAG